MSFFATIGQHLYDDFVVEGRYMYILQGLGNTVVITIFALILGLALGVISSIINVFYANGKRGPLMRVLKVIVSIYITVIRGTPTVVQLMIMYFVILTSGSPLVIAILAFGINSGAYVSEVFRSGIQSVDYGQTEAGRSLGLSANQTMFKIVLPQAIKNVTPAIFNEFITLLKETSVSGYVGIQDLTKGGDIIRSITYDAFTPLLLVAGIYLVIVIGLTQIQHVVERRLQKSDRH
ncbi:MAG: amino acid ABC transporter permease [Lachnospiraceae bacterium]|uniref:Amino acid ABC transporter permease n=1 Tax=Candidatus Weimeria bifida TaxID=2599074 RepID=A0A6N7IYW8_9FIRM|nr:amino acid ABC transporter permease [Candidatus Weimeria bifida]RRF96993.1 MAG: amino acid ABC transporter permease [Lachnospiraceae bacterium]